MKTPTQKTSSNLIRTALLALAALICLGHSADAQARGFRLGRALRIGAYGAKVYGHTASGKSVLRPHELKSCIVTQRKLQTENTQLSALNRQISADEASLKRRIAALKQQPYNAQTVEYLKGKATRLDRQIDQYNARVKRNGFAITSFNAKCSGKEYYDSDYNKVMAEIRGQ